MFHNFWYSFVTFHVNAAANIAYALSMNGWFLLIAAAAIASVVMYLKEEVDITVHEEQQVL